jgi:GTP-binding protein
MNIGLIGATNVGKSTLFNRLIGQFRAIVTDIPGTTVDIIKHQVKLEHGELMSFFDSPGLLDFTDELPYIEQIVKDSDLLLFLVDDSVGITAKEQHILDLIRKEKKQNATILIVNKLDMKWKERETELALADYYDLGIANVIGISAKTERNLHEVEKVITKHYQAWKQLHPEEKEMATAEEKIGIAIVGKPNAGKSTLLNTLVGKELAKVADVAGTTRDYLAGEFDYKGKKFIAYDTAGIKRKGNIHGIEKIAYDKTKAMLEFTRPIVVFMVDCTQGITHRDMTLLQEIHSLALPIIFVLNKVDQVNPKGMEAMIRNAQSYLEFAKYIPIVPMIALKGTGIDDMMKMIRMLQKENQKRV